MTAKNRIMLPLAALTLAALFAGCSGSGGSSADQTALVSIGTMAKGSVIVNGVRFDDTSAAITADDALKTPDFLKDGMTVKVKGTVGGDGVTGVAEKIKVLVEVRGPITSLGADSLEVLGQMIIVDASTIFENGTGLSGLQMNDMVEVHGRRDAGGDIRATRVELKGAGLEDEVRGAVSEMDAAASTFKIGGLLIAFNADTVIDPAGAAFGNGDVVEVHLAAGNVAERIEIEDLADIEFQPAEGLELEVEGFISGFTGHPGTFLVDAQSVATTTATRFEGGAAADLADNIRVEAEGRMSGGVLMAEKIKFKDSARIETNAETASGDAVPTSFTALGKTVMITSATDLHNLSLPIAAGAGVKIRGFLNPDGSINAVRIDSTNAVEPDRHILRGPVSSFDAGAKTLVILGIAVDASGASVSGIEGPADDVETLDLFFSGLTPLRTVVKARGAFTDGALMADKIEIEME